MTANSRYHDDEETPERIPFINSPQPAEPTLPLRRCRFQIYTLSILLSIIFLLELSDTIAAVPTTRLFESIICRNFYKIADPSLIGNDGAVEEEHCKTNPVQEELAFLNGWKGFFDNLPGARLHELGHLSPL